MSRNEDVNLSAPPCIKLHCHIFERRHSAELYIQPNVCFPEVGKVPAILVRPSEVPMVLQFLASFAHLLRLSLTSQSGPATGRVSPCYRPGRVVPAVSLQRLVSVGRCIDNAQLWEVPVFRLC